MEKERRKRVKRKILLAITFFAGLLIVWSFSNGVAYAVSGSDAEGFALKFLEDVAGIDVRYNGLSFSRGSIRGVVDINNAQFEFCIDLVKGKVWFYTLQCAPPSSFIHAFGESNLTVYDCLTIANKSIEQYQKLVDASYGDRPVKMLSAAIEAKNLTVEDEDSSLKISYSEKCSTQLDYERYVMLHYIHYMNLNGYRLPVDDFVMGISKNGLLTYLSDGSIYYVATTDVNVSKEQAINLALSYAEEYAREHGQQITDINATFQFSRDHFGVRGDDHALYPDWQVWINFDMLNEEYCFAYAVSIWADNGEVHFNCPQGIAGSPSVNANSLWLLAVGAVAAFILFPISIAYTHDKYKAWMRKVR